MVQNKNSFVEHPDLPTTLIHYDGVHLGVGLDIEEQHETGG